jgi:hypothetical protein
LSSLYSRLNDKRRGAIVIIMQRLHEDDLVGQLLGQEEWEIIRFPAIGRPLRIGTVVARRCGWPAITASRTG